MKPLNKGRVQGFIISLLFLVACGVSYPYKYYAIQMAPECYDKGMLLGVSGSDGWPDKPLTEIKPDATTKLKSITLFIDDFYAAKGDYLKCHNDLIACQKKCP